jgi:glutamine amidotransferase
MIAVLQYNAGNSTSVLLALRRLGVDAVLTDNPELLASADKVIFPGVGQASSAMIYLRDRKLDEAIRTLQQPVLGICLGMQLMCSYNEEGKTTGLGIFSEAVQRFPPDGIVPHTGWNQVAQLTGPLFMNLPENSDVYFVHSYYVATSAYTVATCDYLLPFSAAIQKNNFYAVQFHPEKSGAIGQRILQNFLSL